MIGIGINISSICLQHSGSDSAPEVTPFLVGSQTVNSYAGGKTNASVTKPTGLEVGHRIIIFSFFLRSGSVPTITPPSGFTPIVELPGTGDGLPYVFQIWTKIATTADVAASNYQFTHETCSAGLACTAWGNANFISAAMDTRTTTTTSTVPGFTPKQGNLRLLVGMHNWTGNPVTTPSGMTVLNDNFLINTFHEERDASNVTIATRTFANANGSGDPSKTVLLFMSDDAIVPLINMANYANASTTGPRTSLTPSGTVTTSSDGQVIEGLDIAGVVVVNHNNVTIRDCRITMNNVWGINNSGAGTTVEYCTITTSGGGSQGSAAVLMGHGTTVRYCDISGVENGIQGGGNGITILNNYIHDLASVAVEAHYDGIQSTGNITDLTIKGNTISTLDTSNIILQNEDGGYSGFVLIEGNYLEGEVATPIYLRGDKSASPWSAVATVKDNVFAFTNNGLMDTTSGPSVINWENNLTTVGAIIPSY